MSDKEIDKLSDEQTVNSPGAPSEAGTAENASGTVQDNAPDDNDGSTAESEEALNKLREDLRRRFQPADELDEYNVAEVARLMLLKAGLYRQYSETRDTSRSHADFEKDFQKIPGKFSEYAQIATALMRADGVKSARDSQL